MTWKTLCHPNVLPLLKVTMDDAQFVMISDWMVNGNVTEYIGKHGDTADRFGLVRVFGFSADLARH